LIENSFEIGLQVGYPLIKAHEGFSTFRGIGLGPKLTLRAMTAGRSSRSAWLLSARDVVMLDPMVESLGVVGTQVLDAADAEVVRSCSSVSLHAGMVVEFCFSTWRSDPGEGDGQLPNLSSIRYTGKDPSRFGSLLIQSSQSSHIKKLFKGTALALKLNWEQQARYVSS
jgi:hypothetical protein